MAIDRLVAQLAEEMELEEPLSTEMPGVFEIPLDEAAVLRIVTTPQGMVLTCPFASCPKEVPELFLTHALRANLFGEGTGGAVLGIDEKSRLVLSRTVEQTLAFAEFRDLIEDFANSVDFWQKEAQAYLVKSSDEK